MHPDLSHQLTRAILADREREARTAARHAPFIQHRDRGRGRQSSTPRFVRARRASATVGRLRPRGGAPDPGPKAGVPDAA